MLGPGLAVLPMLMALLVDKVLPDGLCWGALLGAMPWVGILYAITPWIGR